MTGAEWFVVGIVVMQWGATAFYGMQGKWPEAAMWFLIGASNLAWIWKVLSEH